MPNLEKLGLYFAVYADTFIDGDHVKKNIFNHMPRLNSFTYNIRSMISLTNQTYLPSTEHIQDTRTNLGGHYPVRITGFTIVEFTTAVNMYLQERTSLL